MTRRPLIAHVIDSLDSSGGAEGQLIANLQSFDHSRMSHELVLLRHMEVSRRDEVPPQVPVSFLFCEGEPVRPLRGAVRLKKLAKERRYDLVHAALPGAALGARIMGTMHKAIVVESLVNISHEPVRTLDNPAVTPLKLRLHTLIDRITMRGVSHFHAVSHAVAESWQRVVGLRADRIEVIPRGIDPSRIQRQLGEDADDRERLCEEFGWDEEPWPIVVAVGRQEPQKGHRYLIEAVARLKSELPGLRAVIVGRRGNSSVRLEELIHHLGLEGQVALAGVRPDPARFLAAADIFAFPSLFEGNGGNAMIEAMAIGLPIITTKEPPMTDLIPDDRHGLLIPRADSKALASAIMRLAQDNELRALVASHARQRARSFPSPQQIAARYEEWYEKLLVARQ